MTLAIEVFNRYEKKYMMDMETFEKVKERISQYMDEDQYSQGGQHYTICNLYYDTENNELINHSISSPFYKEKLRLRGYGVPTKDSKVYLEIKKKFNGIVNKRRSAMTLEEAYNFIETGEIPEIKDHMNVQILEEIQQFLQQRNKLVPATYLAYDRMAYFQKDNRDLRMSFDFNIRTRRFDMGLEEGDHGRFLLEEGKVLMEIKASRNMPLWLVRMLSEFKIYPSKFSKYGTEYIQMQTVKNATVTDIQEYKVQAIVDKQESFKFKRLNLAQ